MEENFETLWDTKDIRGNELEVSKLASGDYEVIVDSPNVVTAVSITLDRKQMKDLFNAIGNELNAFG